MTSYIIGVAVAIIIASVFATALFEDFEKKDIDKKENLWYNNHRK